MDSPSHLLTTLRLAESIYDSAADPTCWGVFVDRWVAAIGGWAGAVALHSAPQGPAFRSSKWPEAECMAYLQSCRNDAEGRREGAIFFPGGRRGIAGLFRNGAGGPSLLVALRDRNSEEFGDAETALLRELMPHLRKAVELGDEVAAMRAQLSLLSAHLDRQAYAFLLLDENCEVVFANATAHEAARRDDGLSMNSGRVLVSNGEQHLLMNALRRAANGQAGSNSWLEVQRFSRKPPYRLLLMPLAPSHLIPPGYSRAVAAVLLVDSDPGPEIDAAILRRGFALTPAEAKVASKLASGQSANEIAAGMGISLETVRTHIRRMLSKTSTGRQGELISQIMRIAPFRQPPR